MSMIHIIQKSVELVGLGEIGSRCFPSFDGPTTTWAWVLTSVPPGSATVMNDPSTSQPSFDPDAYGTFDVQFTDDAANVFTSSIVISQPVGSEIIDLKDDEDGRAYYMPDTTGVDGKSIRYFGQSTDGTHLGGAVEIGGGAGYSSYGVVISERMMGSDYLSHEIVRFSASEGLRGIMACIGGSESHFTFDCSAVTDVQFLGGAATCYKYDVGADQVLQMGPGDTIGFHGTTPVVQATRPGQLSDSTGGSVDGTLVDVTTAALADPAKCNSNFADLIDRVNKLETILHNLGLST